jgi:ribonucleoside-diphosphate reductase alpha chain
MTKIPSFNGREPFYWHNAASQRFMAGDYLLPGQSLLDRVDIIAAHAQQILQTTGEAANHARYAGWAEKFTHYMARGWYSLSTPIWANFGTERGLPISCFGTYLSDSMDSILTAQAEVGILTKNGGGTSGYLSALRPRGSAIKNNGQSLGAVHFAQLFENQTKVISQGSTRRGQFAGYLDVEHNDIEEWLTIRTEGSPLQDISFGVCVGDNWLAEMKAGDKTKRRVWGKILECRSQRGYPYLFFKDNANNGAPQVYKDQGLTIWHTNLCTEIMESNAEDETFVCDLMSQNVQYFEEWEHTDATAVAMQLLDAVMSDFIVRAGKIKFMERAVRFAERQRAVGLGQLGWHTFLQTKSIPFDSMEAKIWNVRIAKAMDHQSLEASQELARHFGEPELLRGYGVRNALRLAIAPTTSSSFILQQVSQSVEPRVANVVVKEVAKLKYTLKNPELEALLESKGHNTSAVWLSIMQRAGSVAHLGSDILTDHEKAVYKTFAEISQREIIIQAAQRQKYIDQGQSLNMMIHPSVTAKDLNTLILEAHSLGIKSLYYQHSVNAAQEFARDLLQCASCE